MTAPLRPAEKRDPLAVLTQAALVILLAVVAARCSANELQNDAFGFGGSADAGGGPGPSTTILLNLLCFVPALLVLVRRAIDPQYVLRWHVSQAIAFGLAAWVSLSAIWAGNKFDALLMASNWWAAAAVLWAAGQLVRSWTRLRPALGVATGLGLIFLAQGLIYKYYEQPELQHYWETDPQLKARRDADPNDFLIKQMDRAVHGNAQQGFFRSPNTFAAAVVLAGIISVGFAGQRLMTKDEPGFAAAIGVAVLALPLLVWWTGSRTAGGAAMLAGIALVLAWLSRDSLAARSKSLYFAGAALVVLAIVAVVGIGLSTGGLVHDSLNFRWNYWVASARMFAAHPILGVGWTNFGDHYLAYRLPVAAEEIKDPHNVFVRFATEAGVVGLVLAIAWLTRAVWEITRPVLPKTPLAPAMPVIKGIRTGPSWMHTAILIALLYAVLRAAILASLIVPQTAPLAINLPELGKTLLFGLLMLTAMLMTCVRTAHDPTADDRPAPFLLYATIVALLAFLLHNQVDFALSETGPLLLFMLVLGAVLGIRHPGVAGKKSHTAVAVGGLAVAGLGLIAAIGLWAVPVWSAEAKIAEANAVGPTGRTADALRLCREAMIASPVPNPDYARTALRWTQTAEPRDVLSLMSQVIEAAPRDAQAWLNRARAETDPRFATPAEVTMTDYLKAIQLNPNDPTFRLEYAGYLNSIGKTVEANNQIRAALDANDKLNPDEPRRLPADKVEEFRRRVGK